MIRSLSNPSSPDADTVKVLKVFETQKNPIRFEFDSQLLGGVSVLNSRHFHVLTLFFFFEGSIDVTGEPLTASALEAATNADAVLLGAIGGPVSSGEMSNRRHVNVV